MHKRLHTLICYAFDIYTIILVYASKYVFVYASVVYINDAYYCIHLHSHVSVFSYNCYIYLYDKYIIIYVYKYIYAYKSPFTLVPSYVPLYRFRRQTPCLLLASMHLLVCHVISLYVLVSIINCR